MIRAAKRKNKAWHKTKNIVWYEHKSSTALGQQDAWCPKHGITTFAHKDPWTIFSKDVDELIGEKRKVRNFYIWICSYCHAISLRQGKAF